MFGLGLLILLLAICLGGDYLGRKAPDRIANTVYQAACAALAEDWETAEAFSRRAGRQWIHTRNFQVWLRHEDLLQQVDTLFSQLQAVLPGRDPGLVSAVCMSIRSRAGALAGHRYPGTGQ